jgi:hypothetical protein
LNLGELWQVQEVLDMNANEMLQHLKEKLGSLGQACAIVGAQLVTHCFLS